MAASEAWWLQKGALLSRQATLGSVDVPKGVAERYTAFSAGTGAVEFALDVLPAPEEQAREGMLEEDLLDAFTAATEVSGWNAEGAAAFPSFCASSVAEKSRSPWPAAIDAFMHPSAVAATIFDWMPCIMKIIISCNERLRTTGKRQVLLSCKKLRRQFHVFCTEL